MFGIFSPPECDKPCQRRSKNPQKRRSKIPQKLRSGERGGVAAFRWSTATPWRRGRCWWGDDRFGADVLRHEFGMLPEAIARTLDLHDHGVVEQPVEQCSGDDG